eukprot:TRINITY_DN9078_c0_g1_i4.p1 TRINITY_DN9078_c0_g1~~TRINITY_DN9078_c0_g1_i4.p1  ORF type:complete len:555 (-),score=147.14 TRINITY_DN9078_c0_g1_i4:90-1754(-)
MESAKSIMERIHGNMSGDRATEVNAEGTPKAYIPSGGCPYMTTNFGMPTGDATHALNIGGYPVVSDVILMEKQQTFNRAKTLERAVHASGSGGMGYFEVTKDMSKYCKAEYMSGVGKKTPVTARFSTVTYGREFPDSSRNPRGLAFKFYTEEGNHDILAINFPVFFTRDPIQGPDVIRTQQRNPQNFMINYDAMFDWMSLVPESMLCNTWFWSDHGTPYGWRYMDAFPCHTFKWVNASGEAHYVKYKFKCDQGIKNFDFDTAILTCGKDPDFAKRDLFAHIEKGGSASWTVCVQIMTPEEAVNYKFDPCDNTKIWPDLPWVEFGKLVINKNPENYHRDIEQVAFSPGRLVPGIEPSNDPLLQFRMFLYGDAQMHRLGVNYHQIPVNCPYRAKEYHPMGRDGPMRVDNNGGFEPHYMPNSMSKPPCASPDPRFNWGSTKVTGVLERKNASKHAGMPDDDYVQVRDFFNSMSETDKEHLYSNIASSLKLVNKQDIIYRFIASCYKASPAYAAGIQKAMAKEGRPIDNKLVEQVGKGAPISDVMHAYKASPIPMQSQ